jgi:hypothetical protein
LTGANWAKAIPALSRNTLIAVKTWRMLSSWQVSRDAHFADADYREEKFSRRVAAPSQ